MKQVRALATLIFVLCAFALSAMAQKQWVYRYDDGRKELNIIIRERAGAVYDLGGEYKEYSNSQPCKIKGAYQLAGGHVRGYCEYLARDGKKLQSTLEIDGIYRGERIAISISGYTFVARRVGKGEPLPTAGVTGKWSIEQAADSGARYTGTLILKQTGNKIGGRAQWDNHSSGEVDGTVQGEVINFRIIYEGGLIGTYRADLSEDGMLNGTATSNKGGGRVHWQAFRR